MKAFIAILLILGAGGIGFGYWGLNTAQGQARFDEMAGMIPYFVQVAGYVAVVLAVVLMAIRYWMAQNGSTG